MKNTVWCSLFLMLGLTVGCSSEKEKPKTETTKIETKEVQQEAPVKKVFDFTPQQFEKRIYAQLLGSPNVPEMESNLQKVEVGSSVAYQIVNNKERYAIIIFPNKENKVEKIDLYFISDKEPSGKYNGTVVKTMVKVKSFVMGAVANLSPEEKDEPLKALISNKSKKFPVSFRNMKLDGSLDAEAVPSQDNIVAFNFEITPQ